MDKKNLAIIEDAKNMANIAVWSVELQLKRLMSGKHEIEEFVMQPVVDFHFLIVALTRLRQAASLMSAVSDLSKAISDFDASLPNLRTVRNILEHIDEYRVGEGKNKSVPSSSFQTIEFNDQNITWVGYEINLEHAKSASSELFLEIKESHNKALHLTNCK